MNRILATLIAVPALFAATAMPAQATEWNFERVLGPGLRDGGFGFSSLHRSDGSNVMSGSNLAHFGLTDNVTNTTGAASGTYNDVTGALDVNFYMFGSTNSASQIGTMHLSGTLGPTWTGIGGLGALSYTISFTSAGSTLENFLTGKGYTANGAGDYTGDNLLFNQGFQCCASAGTDAPNSFVTAGGDATMTLWGATGGLNGVNGNGKYLFANSAFGSDFRFELTEVPEPATLSLFGFGLAGLGLASRRRRTK